MSLQDTPVVDEPFIATAGGNTLGVIQPDPNGIEFSDIAIGIARNCRYSGQFNPQIPWYSVAEHCSIMTDYAIKKGIATTGEAALSILMHDASEAFLSDVVSPIKVMLPQYKRIEDTFTRNINLSFGLHDNPRGLDHETIKNLDMSIRLDEIPSLILQPALSRAMISAVRKYPDAKPLGVSFSFDTPGAAAEKFAQKFIDICYDMPMDKSMGPILERHIVSAKKLIDTLNMSVEQVASDDPEP